MRMKKSAAAAMITDVVFYTCDIHHDRVSKNLCKLILCSLSVKYEPISIKIGMVVSEETLNKTAPKMSTSPKSMCLHYPGKFEESD